MTDKTDQRYEDGEFVQEGDPPLKRGGGWGTNGWLRVMRLVETPEVFSEIPLKISI